MDFAALGVFHFTQKELLRIEAARRDCLERVAIVAKAGAEKVRPLRYDILQSLLSEAQKLEVEFAVQQGVLIESAALAGEVVPPNWSI